jgi:outer membrane protein assembly factor BamB
MHYRLALALMFLPSLTFAGDWPQFRGPGAGGVAEDTELPVTWSQTENVRWKSEIPGRGVSCPIVFDGRIYITTASGVRGDRLHVLAYDAATGKEIWQRQITATGNTGCHPKSSMAAPTPVANKDGVYALFATGDLVAFDRDGNLKWYRSLAGDYPAIANQVGMASSPVLYRDILIVPMDSAGESFIAGVDTQYGRNLWKTPRKNEINWVTPSVRTVGDKSEILFQARTELTSYDPSTGKKNWEYKLGGGGIPSAVMMGDQILVPTGKLLCLKVTDNKPEEVWNSQKLASGTTSPLVYQGKVYNVSSTGLVCADPKTGKDLWMERLKGRYSASLIAGAGRIYAFNETGLTTVVRGGDTAEVLAQNDIGEEILGTPAIHGGTIIIRTDKHLWCIGTKK